MNECKSASLAGNGQAIANLLSSVLDAWSDGTLMVAEAAPESVYYTSLIWVFHGL